MRALSIRQPYAELILRGIKPIEFWFDKLTAGRSQRTGEANRPAQPGIRFGRLPLLLSAVYGPTSRC
jgi:hypothetical protein